MTERLVFRASVVIAKSHRPVGTGLLSNCYEGECLKIRLAFLTGWAIKFVRFRNVKEVVYYLRIVFPAIVARFFGFVRPDSCLETFLSALLSFLSSPPPLFPPPPTLSFSLCLSFSFARFVLPPRVFSSFSFYHFYWTPTTVSSLKSARVYGRGAIQ